MFRKTFCYGTEDSNRFLTDKIVYSWIPVKTIQKPRDFQVTNRSWFNPLQGRLQDAKNKTTAEEKHRVLLRFN